MLFRFVIFYKSIHRNNAILIREPELGFNTENKRRSRGGRQTYCGTSPQTCCGCSNQQEVLKLKKRSAEEDDTQIMSEDDFQAVDERTHYINLFDEIADMTDPISSDLALFLFCMLN